MQLRLDQEARQFVLLARKHFALLGQPNVSGTRTSYGRTCDNNYTAHFSLYSHPGIEQKVDVGKGEKTNGC